MDFEWDERKRKSNIQEHGVDFRLASGIFFNPVIEKVDNRKDYGEVRIKAIGIVQNECFLVVYTWRGKTKRIISAWKVGKNGRQKYEQILRERNKKSN